MAYIDCWNVHKSYDFLTWVKIAHPQMLVISILGNYTSFLQPTNVIVKLPFKHSFQQEGDIYNMILLLSNKMLITRSKWTFEYIIMPQICNWLYTTWKHIVANLVIVAKGWKHI